MKQYRHGDLLIQQVESIPQGAKRKKGRTLAEGEATGHHHTLDNGTLYEADGNLYFRLAKPSALTHQEHATIPLPAGIYRCVQQREYQPQAAPRRVID